MVDGTLRRSATWPTRRGVQYSLETVSGTAVSNFPQALLFPQQAKGCRIINQA